MTEKNEIPKHVAIIMDGNGRWAKKKRLPRVLGHNAGMKAMKEIVKKASSLGVEYLTVYAFSTENWKRTKEEINGIFKLLIKYVDGELEELHENNVKVSILGDTRAFPEEVTKRLRRSLETTKNNDGMQFNIALNYGSREEIREAIKSIVYKVNEGDIEIENISDELIAEHLYTGRENIPDPELLIRTSGEKRLSNFLLWQLAYTEMVFFDTLWPDFTPSEFEEAIVEYSKRDRRFGGR